MRWSRSTSLREGGAGADAAMGEVSGAPKVGSGKDDAVPEDTVDRGVTDGGEVR